MFPIGSILFWFGSRVDLPVGWFICDGSNGTPDMEGYFNMCVKPPEEPGSRAETSSHIHSFESIGHEHYTEDGANIGLGAAYDTEFSKEKVSGGTYLGSNTPPFTWLYPIMRLT